MSLENHTQFVWSDAWLLLAIALTDSGEGATLRAIIGAGDYINHAIFNASELRHGMSLLTSAGYVVEREGQYFLAGKAHAFWGEYQTTHKTDNNAMEAVKSFLGVSQTGSSDLTEGQTDCQYPGLTDEVIRQAVEEYSKGSLGL